MNGVRTERKHQLLELNSFNHKKARESAPFWYRENNRAIVSITIDNVAQEKRMLPSINSVHCAGTDLFVI